MISVTESNDTDINLELDGDLTIYVAEKFHLEINQYLEKYDNINLDLSNVSEIDTSCYQVLLRAKLLSNKNQKKFIISSLSEGAAQVFELYNLNNILGVEEASH